MLAEGLTPERRPRIRFALSAVGDRWEHIAWAVLIAAIVAAVFLNDRGLVALDTQPELYFAPGRTLVQSLFAWEASPFLGQAGFNAGIAPVAAVILLIRSFGAQAWLAIRIVRVILVIAAAYGAARLFDHLAGPPRRPIGRLAAALLYVANPYVIVSAVSLPVMLPYAVFPWLMLAFGRSVDSPASWKRPAAFAMAFFVMGGLNAGIVNFFLLLGVPAYVLYERIGRRVGWTALARATAKCLGLAILVSLYWIIPTLLARGSGSTIAITTERPEDVSSTSSYAESLRLLGVWPLYGRQGATPFLPKAVPYVTSLIVVVVTFSVPLFAALSAAVSRARARALAATLLVIGVPVMVGLFPPQSSPPFGRLLRYVFDNVPGAIGFRTTNKVGALVVLGFVLLLALGVAEVAVLVRRWRWWGKGLLVVLALGLVAVMAFPAWSGDLYPDPWKEIPPYWTRAAHDVNGGSASTRVLLLPGETFANYRWGKRGPTDLTDALFSRRSVLRVSVPAGSAFAANYLAAMDIPLNDGTYRKGMLPTLARYLGAANVLVRNDMTWEAWGGVRPSDLAQQIDEPGLTLIRSFGSPGENTTSPGGPGLPGSGRAKDAALPPLSLYAVAASQPIVRAEPVTGSVLIDGDNFGLPAMADFGLLAGTPPFRLMGSMTVDDLTQALRDGTTIVLTDSNRRRTYNFRRTGRDFSPTLPPDASLGSETDLTFRLFRNDPDTQTVALLDGARSVAAAGLGASSNVPRNLPAFAFDGDSQTAWLTGAFGRVLGQRITIQFDTPVDVSSVTLRPVAGEGRRISKVRITAGRVSTTADVPRGELTVAIPPTRTPSLTVQITGVQGEGVNPVGFWEIGIPGVQVSTVARLPLTFSKLAAQLSPDDRARLAATPIDIVLVRQSGSPTTSADDEEPLLDREFTLPAAREFALLGVASLSSHLPDSAVDRLAGVPQTIVADSSSRFEDRVQNRASSALDGDPRTAWIPNTTQAGEYIDVTFPTQTLDRIVVSQAGPSGGAAAYISEADLSLDGGPARKVSLTAGDTELQFPPQTVSRVRLTVRKTGGLGGVVRINELGLGTVHVEPTTGATPLQGCVGMLQIDGTDVPIQLPGTLGQLNGDIPFTVRPCGDRTVELAEGSHHIRAEPGWDVNLLRLTSPGLEASTVPPPGPRLTVVSSTPTRMVIQAPAAPSPYYLVLGQGYDRRWTAAMDGRSLGPPILVDGYSVGWRVEDAGRPHVFVAEFAPQRYLTLGLVLSAVGVMLVLTLLFWRRRSA
jgi:arabinofuranan 3-O-arabinosyltransferase